MSAKVARYKGPRAKVARVSLLATRVARGRRGAVVAKVALLPAKVLRRRQGAPVAGIVGIAAVTTSILTEAGDDLATELGDSLVTET